MILNLFRIRLFVFFRSICVDNILFRLIENIIILFRYKEFTVLEAHRISQALKETLGNLICEF